GGLINETTDFIDCRETAQKAATHDMYKNYFIWKITMEAYGFPVLPNWLYD
ncbi:23787_t:CDS:2, partial [Gigaspora rosea]